MDSLILFCIIGLFGFVFFLINIFTLLNHSALTDMITAEPVALILIIVVYIIDIFLIKELIPSIKKSFGLALKGFQKRFMKRDKLLSADDEKIIARLRELKKVDLNDGKVYRTLHFCQLVQNLENSDCAKECYFEAMCRKETLDEVKQCENILLETAKECKQKGRIEQANQILQEISENNLLFDRDSWNREYEVYEQNVATETEALTNWSFGIVLIIGISILLFTISYMSNAPYRELGEKIQDKTLSWDKTDDTELDLFNTENGEEILVEALSSFHEENDVESALWLICNQPHQINGYSISASSTFIEWVLDFVYESGQNIEDNIYHVGEYEVEVLDDGFTVYNGIQWRIIQEGNPYNEDVLVIQ